MEKPKKPAHLTKKTKRIEHSRQTNRQTRRRNIGFMLFILACSVVWPCLLLYVITRETVFITLVILSIFVMLLSLMFEDSEYSK
mgnify:CR=1 FL=1